ncbi:TPM domain-containing protein [Prosthecochloris sp. ZM_2]|nr:TPM domain-containing protein [Prosthecochloris sp. ZM_2]
MLFEVVRKLCSRFAGTYIERKNDEANGHSAQGNETFGRVNDEAGVLSVLENEQITKLIEKYESETSHQLCVITVRNLGGESIETYSLRVASKLGLGLKGIDNGILIVVAPNDRKARIELGQGFEDYISSSRAQEIMDTQMIPAFKQQEYAAGIERGLTLLMSDGRAFIVRR